MKGFYLIFLFFYLSKCLISFSQELPRVKKLKESEYSIYEVFKNLQKTDQQYVVLKYAPDLIKKVVYENNLKIVKLYIDRGYFSSDSIDNYSQKAISQINQSTSIILFHLIKYCPDIIFSNENMSYLENKFSQNLFPKKLIIYSLSYYYTLVTWKKFHPDSKEYELVKRFDHQYDDLFYEALKRWGIDESTLNHDAIKFIGH